jgi:hypothetical protein
MEHDLGLSLDQDRTNPVAVAYIATARRAGQGREGVRDLLVNHKKAELGMVEHRKVGAGEGGHLPADFRTNAAAGTGDQYPLSGDQSAHTFAECNCRVRFCPRPSW